MKTTFTIIILSILFSLKTHAQCSSCTTNITGLDASNHIISAGQVFCIAPTGTVTGLITVSVGGVLCNQGKMTSTDIWIAGGTFYNYGTINAHNVLVSSAGTYTNYFNSTIDSMLITGTGSSYKNSGTLNNHAFGIADHAVANNAGTINTLLLADSVSNFVNNGTINVLNGLSNAYNSTFSNNGNLTITNDLSNAYNSNFFNYNYMSVGRDFANSNTSLFTTICMIPIGRDWYNSATLYTGSSTACGGFSVTGLTLNSGSVGTSGTSMDICDAGHPVLGMDGPGGTITNVTYCSCINSCSSSVGIKEQNSNELISSIYPNPASNLLSVKLNHTGAGIIKISIVDVLGKIVLTKIVEVTSNDNVIEIPVSNLSEGTYVLTMSDAKGQQVNKIVTVVK